MKKLIAFVSLVAMQLTPAMAHVGGPWSGGTVDSHISGIFGGIMTLRNGSGIFRFSQTDGAQLSAFSASMIYYKGVTFLGSCQAHIDWPTRKIAGMTNGSAYNRSPAVVRQEAPPLVDNNPNFNPQDASLQQRTLTVSLTPAVAADGTITTRTFQTSNLGAAGPVGIANTHWQGKLTTTAPIPRFEAKGQAAFLGEQPSILEFDIVEGATRTFNTPVGPVEVPGPLERLSVGRGGNDPFPKPRNTEKIRVFGSRISYTAVPSFGGQQGGLIGTGGGGFSF